MRAAPSSSVLVARWERDFDRATERGDLDDLEELSVAPVTFERLELHPAERFFTLDEVIAELGFNPAEFGR